MSTTWITRLTRFPHVWRPDRRGQDHGAAFTVNEDGTELVAVHEHLPPGLSPTDNELGWQEALGKLATLVESASR